MLFDEGVEEDNDFLLVDSMRAHKFVSRSFSKSGGILGDQEIFISMFPSVTTISK